MPLSREQKIEYLQLAEEKAKRSARRSHIDFMRYTWRGMSAFASGFHTRKICARIDQAIADYREGKSTYLLINVHPRSGKSSIVSQYLGPHFLGEFPQAEVMQVSFAADKAVEFSAYARGIVESSQYQALYPALKLSDDTNRKDHYLTNVGGGLMATGLQGHLTGSGFVLGILDDYCAGRAEAESKVQRDNMWNAFKDDFMTRAAPVSIVIVLATWWHSDDISGRIRQAMIEDEDFPRFEMLTFPARAKDYDGEGKYPNEYLFEERYSKKWYETQYAILGKYSSSALFDCNPISRTGGRFSVAGIEWLDAMPDKRWIRVWDLAHTAKQRSGDDPDYTSGTKLCFERRGGDLVPHLWIANVFRTREDAAKRDPQIKALAIADGTQVRQGVEVSLDAKDAFHYLKQALPQIAWSPIQCKRGDKATRAVPLEPIFEAPGHVHVLKAGWNDEWINELLRFDGLGKDHDDQVDNLSAGYQWQMTQYIGVGGK
jgi:predicted phage terminase large subunit-like protein